MTVRERTLEIECETLGKRAMLAKNTKGRLRDEPECQIRTCYQRDRDRIIHSNAFRRLMHKTQVFLAPDGDHYRTRLTHTLEVSHIARAIAAGLRLNQDLTEAVALGHDLGHTPFGHAGERALSAVMPGGFRHYEQSLRVVDVIENEGKGLNLSHEVRDGILCHTRGRPAETLEGQVVKLADRIAYINHDIDDAVRAGVISESGLPGHTVEILGKTKSERINTLVLSAIDNTGESVALGEQVGEAFDDLHRFMFDMVYTNPVCKSEETKAVEMIKTLFDFFSDNPTELPNEYIKIAWLEGTQRAACDYIAGMTDGFAVKTFCEYFIPKGWQS